MCKFCLDKKRNGGRGLKKQCCVKRRCMHTAKNVDEVISRLSQFRDEHGILDM